jgi:hypothetical protein
MHFHTNMQKYKYVVFYHSFQSQGNDYNILKLSVSDCIIVVLDLLHTIMLNSYMSSILLRCFVLSLYSNFIPWVTILPMGL